MDVGSSTRKVYTCKKDENRNTAFIQYTVSKSISPDSLYTDVRKLIFAFQLLL